MNHPQTCRLTLLPPMPLRHDDDGNFEALDHYFTRLADSVALSTRALARLVWRACGEQGRCVVSLQYRSLWIGPNQRTEGAVSMLSACTGVQDLWRGTFLHLQPALGSVGYPSADDSVAGRKWCPNCYDEWDDSTSFEPLHWAVGSLSVCPTHRVALLARCLHCGSTQQQACVYSNRRTCRSCKRSLGHQAPYRAIETFSSWVNLQAVAVAQVASHRFTPIPPDTFDRYFRRVMERWKEGEPIPKYVKTSLRSLQQAWSRGDRLLTPSLTQYLNVAAFHGTSVEEILLSPETAAAEPLVEGALATFSPYLARRPLKSMLEQVENVLLRLLRSDIEFIPSAQEILTVFDVKPGYFERKLPAASRWYSLNRLVFGRAFRKRDLQRAFSCAVAVLRANGNQNVHCDIDAVIATVAERSRSSIQIARCGVQSARIVLDETADVGSDNDSSPHLKLDCSEDSSMVSNNFLNLSRAEGNV